MAVHLFSRKSRTDSGTARPRRRAGLVSLAAAASLALAACSGGSGGASPTTGSTDATDDATRTTPAETTSVVYLTSFNTFGRDSYVYLAEERGYFEDAGFDVEIRPGTGSVDVMKLLAAGTADYGVADLSATIVGVANESLPVTALAAIHQRSTTALMALESSGISQPTDLAGKKIGDQPGSTNQVIFPTWAKAVGLDPDSVTFVPTQPPALPQMLVSGQVDAIGQLSVGEPLIQAAAGDNKIVVLRYADALPDLYGNVLLTSKDTASANPERAAAFAQALLKGLTDAIEDPQAAADALVAANPTQDATVAAKELELMADAVKVDGTTIGALDAGRVDTMIEILSAALNNPVTAGDIIAENAVK